MATRASAPDLSASIDSAAPPCRATKGVDSVQQILSAKRFSQHAGRAEVVCVPSDHASMRSEPAEIARTRGASGDALDILDQLDPVHVRHEEVRDNQIRGGRTNQADTFMPVLCRDDGMTLAGQSLLHSLAKPHVVIRNHDLGHELLAVC